MIRLMSFNIRYDNKEDGAFAFAYRKKPIWDMISRNAPEVICFQEVLPHMATWLRDELNGYYVVGCGRDENLADEHVCIAFRRERFALCEFRSFWLSPTPEQAASRFTLDQSICPRICSELVLHDLEEHTLYRIFNVHLDHQGALARKSGLALILSRLKTDITFPSAKVILAGDFNCPPQSPELNLLYDNWRDASADLGGTFHDFGRLNPAEKIDYVFLGPGLEAHTACLVKAQNGLFYSDHYPVLVEIGAGSERRVQ